MILVVIVMSVLCAWHHNIMPVECSNACSSSKILEDAGYKFDLQVGRNALARAVNEHYNGNGEFSNKLINVYWDVLEQKAQRENCFGVTLLQKDESVAGKSVCVIAGFASDGFGDVLTYQAWIAMLKACGAQNVTLYLHGKQGRLYDLFCEQQTKDMLGIDTIATGKIINDLPHCDLYVPLCNLPARFNAQGVGQTTTSTVPLYGQQCLFADNAIANAWYTFLQDYTLPCAFNHRASANPTLGGTTTMEERSMPAENFATSLTVNDVATLCYIGGSDHAPIRESVYQSRASNESYAKRDKLDVVPDDYYVVTAQYNQETQAIEVIADQDSGEPTSKIIFVVSQAFADALAVHTTCAKLGGLTATVGTFTEAFAWTSDETYLLLRKGKSRPWRWGTLPGADGNIGRSCWLDSIRIIAQKGGEDCVDGVFERLKEVVKSKKEQR